LVVHGAGFAVIAGFAVGLGGISANSGARIAYASVVTLIQWGTHDWVCSCADTSLAGIGLGASVAVIAGIAVVLGRIGADSGCRNADTSIMALIQRGTHNRIRAGTDASLAGIGLGAEIPVVAGCSVDFVRIRAQAADGIADPGIVALVQGGADHRIRPNTRAGLAGVSLGAEIQVVAACTVGYRVGIAFI
jgi:hypothetical protein